MANTGGIQLVDTFRYSGNRFLDLRQGINTLAELRATDATGLPDGFRAWCAETRAWYQWGADNEVLADTGRWRKAESIWEAESHQWLYVITDAAGQVMLGIDSQGVVHIPKGISDEARARLEALEGWRLNFPMKEFDNHQWLWVVTDLQGRAMLGIDTQGVVHIPSGISDEARQRLEILEGFIFRTMREFDSPQWIYAIVDPKGRLLIGIRADGEVVIPKGIPDQVRKRLEELDGWQLMSNENYLLAFTDRRGRVLMGFDHDGQMIAPKGLIRALTWDEYEAIEKKYPEVLYCIIGSSGMIEGCYLDGRLLQSGEEFGFIMEANQLLYRGQLVSLPKVWNDTEEMAAYLDYPNDYKGPRFEVEDGLLWLR